MRDVTLMPKRDVLKRSLCIRADHPGQSADLLARDGVLLVRHRRRALLSFGEILGSFPNFRALQMAYLERDLFEAAGESGERGHKLRMAIPLDHLGRHWRGFEAQPRADFLLH